MLNHVAVIGGALAQKVASHPAVQRASGRLSYLPGVRQAEAKLASECITVFLLTDEVASEECVWFLGRAREACPKTVAVVLSASPAAGRAIRAVHAGALDCVPLSLDDDSLEILLARLTRHVEGSPQDRFFSSACPPEVPVAGTSPGITQALSLIRVVAVSRCNPILILGETGTGKELAARAAHRWRFGTTDRFVAVNCAALTAGLLESELFGHVKGAFTGAVQDKTGLFELAQGGSIFLDEVSEMPGELQAKLLRVLQERTFRRVGGLTDIACQATIIASSNRNLLEEVRAGRFRQDLYHRLALLPIRLPSLREPCRCQDVPLLAEYLLSQSALQEGRKPLGLSDAARRRLTGHDWPGNVRELKNVMERALILEESDEITPASVLFDYEIHSARPAPAVAADSTTAGPAVANSDQRPLPDGRGSDMPIAHGTPPSAAGSQPVIPAAAAANPQDFSLEAVEQELIRRVLKETSWHRTNAAAMLGITRATLHAKLKRYGIQPPAPSETSK